MDSIEAGRKLLTLLPQMYGPADFGRKLYYNAELRPLEGQLPNPSFTPPGMYWDMLVRAVAGARAWGPLFELLLQDRPRWKPELVEIRAWCMRVVAFLAASPPDLKQLQVVAEQQGLLRELVPGQGVWSVHPDTSADVASWRKVLQAERPNIVHFAGHAGPDGLQVEGGLFGGSHTYSAAALAELFTVRRGDVDLVVLNGCSSAAVGQALVEAGVPAAIGTRRPVTDPMAIAFTEGLYGALAAGARLSEAYAQGIQNPGALQVAGGAAGEVYWCKPEPLPAALRALA